LRSRTGAEGELEGDRELERDLAPDQDLDLRQRPPPTPLLDVAPVIVGSGPLPVTPMSAASLER